MHISEQAEYEGRHDKQEFPPIVASKRPRSSYKYMEGQVTDMRWAWADGQEEWDTPDVDLQDVSWAFPLPPFMEKARRPGALFCFPQGLDAGAIRMFDIFDGSSPRSQ